MLKEIRKTAAGVEYWDTEAKKVIIGEEGLAKKEEKSVVDPDTNINLDEMNAEQLLTFAKENEIDVPGNMSKEETIRKHIAEELAVADK